MTEMVVVPPREAFVLGLRIIWEAATCAVRRRLVTLTFESGEER